MEDFSEEAVATLLRSNGIEPTAIDRVSDSVVYRIEIGGGEGFSTGDGVVYAKRLALENADRYRRLVAANDEPPGVGLPESRVLESDGAAALLSAPAEGWPLSRVLPVALLPGAWRRFRDGLIEGYRAMGTYVGTLHRRLETGRRPVDPEHLIGTDGIGQHLSATTRDRIGSLYERVIGREVPTARIKSDLTPHNAFYRDGDVSLIDFSLRIRPLAREVANLRVSLELMARRLPYPAERKVSRLIDAFESGYEPSIVSRGDRSTLLAAFEVSYLCKVLTKYIRNAHGASAHRWAFTLYDRRCVIELLERKTQALDGIKAA